MIAFPSSVRVWLAVGRTDMGRGMNGLALQVQQSLGRDPHAGDLYVFRGARGDLKKSSGTTALGCRYMQNGWRNLASSGHRRVTVWWRFPRRSWAICLTESTGEIRATPGARQVPDNIWRRNFSDANGQNL